MRHTTTRWTTTALLLSNFALGSSAEAPMERAGRHLDNDVKHDVEKK
jgi:hypothetical protein